MKATMLVLMAGLAMASFPGSSLVGSSLAAEPCPKAAVEQGSNDDRRTSDEIRRRIESDDTVSRLARQVTVTTMEGVVTLRGPVDSSEERLLLASLAESAPGVRHVEDRLEVRR